MRWLYHLHRIYFPQIKVLANSFPSPFFNKNFPSFFFPPFSLFCLLYLFLHSPFPAPFPPHLTACFLSLLPFPPTPTSNSCFTVPYPQNHPSIFLRLDRKWIHLEIETGFWFVVLGWLGIYLWVRGGGGGAGGGKEGG